MTILCVDGAVVRPTCDCFFCLCCVWYSQYPLELRRVGASYCLRTWFSLQKVTYQYFELSSYLCVCVWLPFVFMNTTCSKYILELCRFHGAPWGLLRSHYISHDISWLLTVPYETSWTLMKLHSTSWSLMAVQAHEAP